MSWWTSAPIIMACIGMMILPGLLLALSLGFRRVSAVGLAPALTAGIAGVVAIVAPFLGLRWSIWALAWFTVLLSVMVFLVRMTVLPRFGREAPRATRDSWPVLLGAAGGVIIAGTIIVRDTVGLIGDPQNIAQRFDNVFHLNAVRFIRDNGNASTLNLGAVADSEGRPGLYPATWHSFAALVAEIGGTGVAEAVNVVNIVVAAVVWPVSMVFLARVVAGARPIALLSTGILSAGFIAFPFLMMVWGPLFPYMLSVALLPAALGVVVLLVDMGRDQAVGKPMLGITLSIAVAGIALSHMSSINTLLVLTLPVVVWAAARKLRALVRSNAGPQAFLFFTAIAVAYVAVFLMSWILLRPGPYDAWGPHQTPGGAIGEALAHSPMNFEEVPVLVTVLGLAGLVTVVRSRRDAWVGVSFVLVAYLYVVDAAFDRSPLRAALTGIWYADTNRVAAILPVVSALLGGLAVSAFWSAQVDRVSRVRGNSTTPGYPSAPTPGVQLLGVTGGALVAVLLASGVQSSALQTYLTESEEVYLRDWPDSVLSSDEYALLDRLDEEVPSDAVIAVNPWNGGSLAYAFTGREVTVNHLSGTTDPEVRRVSSALNRASYSPRICNAIRATGVSYVLDFGDQYLASNPAAFTYGGLTDLEFSDAVELVDEQGDAKLYRIVVCQ